MRRKPQLLPDWRDILRRAWSIRLMLLAGLLSGCEAVLSAVGADWLPVPRWASSLIVLVVIAAAFVTRLLAQQGAKDDT
jgi:hypothetical protein